MICFVLLGFELDFPDTIKLAQTKSTTRNQTLIYSFFFLLHSRAATLFLCWNKSFDKSTDEEALQVYLLFSLRLHLLNLQGWLFRAQSLRWDYCQCGQWSLTILAGSWTFDRRTRRMSRAAESMALDIRVSVPCLGTSKIQRGLAQPYFHQKLSKAVKNKGNLAGVFKLCGEIVSSFEEFFFSGQQSSQSSRLLLSKS